MAPHGIALVAHGAGSTADFAARAFRADDLGVARVLTLDDRTGDQRRIVGSLRRAHAEASAEGQRVRFVAGVSAGAHAVARWVAADSPAADGVLLALPAWTGEPDAVAAATVESARAVRRLGVEGVLAGLEAASPDDWVVRELAAAWPAYGTEALARCLLATGRSPGPGIHSLAAIAVPCGIAALADDPLHPETVARAWAEAIPCARLEVIPRRVTDVAAIGRAAMRAWERARAS